MAIFHRKEVEAIYQIPLSRRNVPDSIFWLHNSRGLFTVKSTYHVARRLLIDENWVGTSRGCAAKNVQAAIWKLWLLNEIKVFAWRACHEILPIVANLTRRRVINDDKCSICTRETKSTIHALWDCVVAQDFWAGSTRKLQKGKHGQSDMLHLMEEFMEHLTLEQFELFWTQVWIVWNRHI